MVTFETQCYENDYEYLFSGNVLKKKIANCNHRFTKKVVIINKVKDRKKVAALADIFKQKKIIDEYYFAEDYIDKVLAHFQLDKNSFDGGYYFSRCQLVGLYLCKTKYLLHFTTDSFIESKPTYNWIDKAIKIMEKDKKYACATPHWNNDIKGAQNESIENFGDWYAGYGFSDNCYLVPTQLFKQPIYNEKNFDSERFPVYAGECFEKRVDSYLRNHHLMRLISKKVSYVHTTLPRKPSLKLVDKWNQWQTQWRFIKRKIKNKVLPTQDPLLVPVRNPTVPDMTIYRKSIKIYDVFTLFNELDLLEIRLAILDPYVDYFVIVECSETFSGKPKKLYYQENKQRFKKFHHKIIHHITKKVPSSEQEMRQILHKRNSDPLEKEIIENALLSDNVPTGELHWLKEFYQKESIKKALTKLKENDICFISDVDEIWNPKVKINFKSDLIFKLKQKVYIYYLNNRSNEPWAGTLVTQYKNIKFGCLNHLRTRSKNSYVFIEDGGWHFSFQGGVKQIQAKLDSYGHQEFNTSSIRSKLQDRLAQNKDVIGRSYKYWLDESDLPAYIKENKQKYRRYFK